MKVINFVKKIHPLAIIIFFHIINTFIWLKIDRSYLKLDAWGHYHYSLNVYNFLKSLVHFQFPLTSIKPIQRYGVLVGLVTAPFYFIFGSAQDTAVMINCSIFLPILVLSVYGIGKKLLNRQAGLLAAFILTSYPIIFNNLRIYMLDLPLTSMVALGLYFLIASDNFSDRKNSLLFGLSLGLGLLIKFNYIAFIIGPLFFVLYRTFKQKSLLSKQKIKNIVYIAAIGFFLFLAFYFVRYKEIFQRIYELSYIYIFKSHRFVFSAFLSHVFLSALKYLEVLISEGISLLFLIIFLVNLIFFIRVALKDKWLLYLVLIVPLFFQIFVLSGDASCMVRYAMPMFPAIALISSLGLLQIKYRTFKKFLLFLLITLSLVQFFAISYGLPILPDKIEIHLKKPCDFNLIVFQQNVRISPFLEDKSSHPSLTDWKSSQILNAIMNSNKEKERISVVFLSNVPEILEAMNYQIFKKRVLIDLLSANSVVEKGFYEKRQMSPNEFCMDADYIIISDNINSIWDRSLFSNPIRKKKIEEAREVFNRNNDYFQLIETVNMPDGSSAFIYKNIYKPTLIKSLGIEQGDIKLLFEGGCIRIFYKGTEITKGLGLYVSLFSLYHWRDSREARWEIKKLSDTKLIAKGHWIYIPVLQTWEIELKDKNTINWQVAMTVGDKIRIKKEDFKLMLSDKYKEWFISNGEEGVFDGYFEKYFWKKLWVGDINNQIGVKAVKINHMQLPSVKFRVTQTPPDSFATIEESDQLFNGYAIGCSTKQPLLKNIFSPGRHEYFNAQINIE